MSDEDAWKQIVRNAPPDVRRRIFKRFQEVPATIRDLWKEAKPTNENFLKLRIDMLQLSGWDPAGWSVMEWGRLPTRLREDLLQLWPDFRKMILEEAQKMLKEMRTHDWAR